MEGRTDEVTDGKATSFDFKKGLGARMAREDVEEVASKSPSGIAPHHAHIHTADVEKHGYTDRCPGCSTILNK